MNDRKIVPLFPLDLVQFPVALTPLHIFEPRYRQMLEDVQAGDGIFGIIYRQYDDLAEVGTLVKVALNRPLADGRSNILCIGVTRFRVMRLILDDESPYLRAEIETFEDEPDFEHPERLEDLATTLRDLLKRLIAARRLVDGKDQDEPEDTSDEADDPQLLSFFIAAYLDFELSVKQRWLEMTSTALRLKTLESYLSPLVEEYEWRVEVLQLSKTNGHGGNPTIH